MGFSNFNFHPDVAAGVKAIGYLRPTPIQEQAIPPVLKGHDLMGLAQTGTGKTAAFALPILDRLIRGPRGHVRALIVAPTRELAEQIHEVVVSLGGQTRLRSMTIYGGVGMNPQVRSLRDGVEIVVACPGRLLDHISQGTIDLSRVEVLVLDEADRMFDMGFLPDVRKIVKHLPAQRQTLLFAATMPDDIRKLAHEILRAPVTVQVNYAAPHQHRRPRPLSCRAAPENRAPPRAAAPYRHGIGPDLHAHEAPGQARGTAIGEGRLPGRVACRATSRRTGGKRRSTDSVTALIRSSSRRTSRPAASMSRASPTSSTTTCPTPSTRTRTASGARAVPPRPAMPSPSRPEKTGRWSAASNASSASRVERRTLEGFDYQEADAGPRYRIRPSSAPASADAGSRRPRNRPEASPRHPPHRRNYGGGREEKRKFGAGETQRPKARPAFRRGNFSHSS